MWGNLEHTDFDTAFGQFVLHNDATGHGNCSIQGYTKPRCTECGQILWDYPTRLQ